MPLRRFPAPAVLLLFVLTSPAAGQPAAAVPLVDAPRLASRVLPNGLELIVFEDHSVPLVTTELVVRNGSFTETPELNGLSHLYEHMFFKGNEAMVNREPYTVRLGELGIIYNARTNEESVTYFLTTTTPNFPTALQYLRDSATAPVFDSFLLDQEKEVVVGEIDRQESNPYSALINGLSHLYEHMFFKGNQAMVDREPYTRSLNESGII